MSDARNALAARVVGVFNTGSGSCDASSEGQARQIFDEAGLKAVEIVCVSPAEIGGRADGPERFNNKNKQLQEGCKFSALTFSFSFVSGGLPTPACARENRTARALSRLV